MPTIAILPGNESGIQGKLKRKGEPQRVREQIMAKKSNNRRSKHKRLTAKASRFVAPKTLEAFFALPMHIQQTYASVTQAISRMRNDRVSMSRATQEFGLSRQDIQRFGSKAVLKSANGRYVATKR